MNVKSSRSRWLVLFLSVAVAAWGIGLGAKVFELTVLIPAWAANPPTSLFLLPYGPRWPIDPGDFFQPLSILLVIGTVGALIAGRSASRALKIPLWATVIFLVLIWAKSLPENSPFSGSSTTGFARHSLPQDSFAQYDRSPRAAVHLGPDYAMRRSARRS